MEIISERSSQGLVAASRHSSNRKLTILSSICTQQIHGVVRRIEAALPSPDLRRTFFQDPLAIGDAEGFKFPVPSEYDFSLLTEIIKFRFKVSPLSEEVNVENYELFETMTGKVVTADTRLLPGTAITMALLVYQRFSGDERCPMPRCGSDRSSPVVGGGRLWSVQDFEPALTPVRTHNT